MRIIVRVAEDWTVTPLCPDHEAEWQKWRKPPLRQMAKVQDGANRFFPAGSITDPAGTTLRGDDAIEAISAAYVSIVDRAKPQIEALGRYLFDALLGPDLWGAMTTFAGSVSTRNLELALAFPADDPDLHRLPWELMRAPSTFVAAGVWNGPIRKLSVAITRLVEGHDEVTLPPEPGLPSVLFVVGTDLADEQIRPGAELIGLLRRLRSDRPIRHWLLERATLRTLEKTVAAFQPEIVHFICHGGIRDDGTPFLDLRMDQGDENPHRTGEQLLHSIGAAGHLPRIVVLSACYTSSASGREEYLPAGADRVAPMATKFVAGGVPIVVGMSGRVSDMTCRLFTRRFGESIVAGEPVVQATALARMASFVEGRDPLASPDWALPTVFLASGVAADAAPFTADRGDAPLVGKWITALGLRAEPVFSGRDAFFEQLRNMLRGQTDGDSVNQALAVFIHKPRLGATRLLNELAIAALLDGHLPVRIAPAKGAAPTTLDGFMRDLAIAIAESPISPAGVEASQLDILRGVVPGAKLDGAVEIALQRRGQITPSVVHAAAQLDLAALLRRAAKQYPRFRTEAARVVVFLDDVDQYFPELIGQLTNPQDGVLKPFGLGTPEHPVPVVFTFHVTDATRPLVGSESEPGFPGSPITTVTLEPFAVGEDMLACSLILLHPHLSAAGQDAFTTKAWTFVDVDRDEYESWSKAFRGHLEGKPHKIASRDLYDAAGYPMALKRLQEADDEIWLRRVREAGQAP